MEVVAVDNSDLAADASRLLVYHPKSRSGNHFSLVDGGAILLNATNGGGYFPTRTNAQAIKLTPYVCCNQSCGWLDKKCNKILFDLFDYECNHQHDCRCNRRGQRMKKIPRISESEWEVMKVVWEQAPCSASRIIASLNQRNAAWHPKTVKAFLNRQIGRAHV